VSPILGIIDEERESKSIIFYHYISAIDREKYF